MKTVDGVGLLGQIRVLILVIVFWLSAIILLCYTLFVYLQGSEYINYLAFSLFFLLLAIVITLFFRNHQKKLKWIEEQKKILDKSRKK